MTREELIAKRYEEAGLPQTYEQRISNLEAIMKLNGGNYFNKEWLIDNLLNNEHAKRYRRDNNLKNLLDED